MPIREYRCNGCEHQWEELRKGQTHAEECPQCKSPDLTRLLGAAGLAFVGDGWYRNDKARYEPVKQVTFGPQGQVGDVKLLPPNSNPEFNKPTPKPKKEWW
jgi:hypothetical protein